MSSRELGGYTVTLGRYRRYRRQAIEAWLEQLESSDNGHRSRAA